MPTATRSLCLRVERPATGVSCDPTPRDERLPPQFELVRASRQQLKHKTHRPGNKMCSASRLASRPIADCSVHRALVEPSRGPRHREGRTPGHRPGDRRTCGTPLRASFITVGPNEVALDLGGRRGHGIGVGHVAGQWRGGRAGGRAPFRDIGSRALVNIHAQQRGRRPRPCAARWPHRCRFPRR